MKAKINKCRNCGRFMKEERLYPPIESWYCERAGCQEAEKKEKQDMESLSKTTGRLLSYGQT